MNKKGDFVWTQVAGTILAIAVVFALLYFAAIIFVPMFDKGDEIAKSYFDTLKDEIKVADKGNVGEFFIWDIGDVTKGDNEYYLVYFGDVMKVDFSRKVMVPVTKSGGIIGTVLTAEQSLIDFAFDPADILPFSAPPTPTTLLEEYIHIEADMKFQFNSFGRNSNRICVCYIKGSAIFRTEGVPSKGEPVVCNYCEDLGYPVEFIGKDSSLDGWVDNSGKPVSIELKGDKYVFTSI